MELLNTIWGYVLPIGGGLTVGAIIVAIALPILKGSATKIVSRLNIEEIEKKAVERGVEQVKNISFTQNIQPIVKSELVKVTEAVTAELQSNIEKVHNDYISILAIMEKLSAYFDNSIAITDDAKKALKDEIEKAKNAIVTPDIIKVVDDTKETVSAVPAAVQPAKEEKKKKSAGVER